MQANPSNNIHGFTVTSKRGIEREIISPCGVSLPFHPTKNAGQQQPTVISTDALWDTGATSSVITEGVARKLGLVPITKIQSHHAGGTSLVNAYLINIYLPNNICVSYVQVSECKETIGRFGILIGMDVITRGDFAISNFGGKTSMSFRMPSINKIDLSQDGFPKNLKIVEPPKANGSGTPKKVAVDLNSPRNKPCPCGSGKKFKHCCGSIVSS